MKYLSLAAISEMRIPFKDGYKVTKRILTQTPIDVDLSCLKKQLKRRKFKVRKLSKLMSLLLVMAMIFMSIPGAALAAEKDGANTAADETTIVVLTAETKAVPDEAAPLSATNNDADTTLATADQSTDATLPVVATTDDLAVTTAAATVPAADKAVATTTVAAQPATTPDETIIADEETITAMTATYLKLTLTGGTVVDVLVNPTGTNYIFDAAANELTLDNFIGEELSAISNADTFKLVLLGTNVLKTDFSFAVDVQGDLNMSGSGTLIAEGQATGGNIGGGIFASKGITIDSGTYDITAIGSASPGNDIAFGILSCGLASDFVVNGGNINVTAIQDGGKAAYGLYSFGDFVANGGNINIATDSTSAESTGIWTADDIVFNGGYTTIRSNTDTGTAKCLSAHSWVVINNGVLDLCATGGINPLAISGEEGVFISPCYGDVDLTASCLYLEPLCGKDKSHFKHHYAASSNPKTGVETSATDAVIAGLSLLALMGAAVVIGKRKKQM